MSYDSFLRAARGVGLQRRLSKEGKAMGIAWALLEFRQGFLTGRDLPERVKSAVLHVISLAHYGMVERMHWERGRAAA